MQPDVGAVAAKLFYPDGTIQHAGIVTGLGPDRIAGHVYAEAPRDMIGSFGDLLLAREVSAVTAACMVVRHSLFVETGGFDQANLAVSYNDVDFCLRLRERGYRNIVSHTRAAACRRSMSCQPSGFQRTTEVPMATARRCGECVHLIHLMGLARTCGPLEQLQRLGNSSDGIDHRVIRFHITGDLILRTYDSMLHTLGVKLKTVPQLRQHRNHAINLGRRSTREVLNAAFNTICAGPGLRFCVTRHC